MVLNRFKEQSANGMLKATLTVLEEQKSNERKRALKKMEREEEEFAKAALAPRESMKKFEIKSPEEKKLRNRYYDQLNIISRGIGETSDNG